MQVVIIGSGNVATVLGKCIKNASHQIVQVVGRNEDNAKLLANTLACSYTTFDGVINFNADVYLIAISDTALYELPSGLHFKDKLVLHTAGSVSIEFLKNTSSRYGVLYPLQSLRKEMNVIPEIPILIEGNNSEVIESIQSFAKTFSSTVSLATDEQRVKIHVAATIVNNFTNHLYSLTQSFCEQEQINFELLFPLIKETALRLQYISPEKTQTGPAIRNDFVTLEMHYKLLAAYPELRNLYIEITNSIRNITK